MVKRNTMLGKSTRVYARTHAQLHCVLKINFSALRISNRALRIECANYKLW